VSFGFEQPAPAFLGLVLGIAALLAARAFGDILTLEAPLGPPGGASYKPPFKTEAIIRFLKILEWCGALLLFAAAAGPRFIIRELVWLDRGADIVFVLDVSPSMAGLDMDGRSRFDAARKLCLEFAQNRPSDAIGLVAVGSEAGLLLPPTIDRELFYDRLDKLRIGEMGDGTALGLGLAAAALHLRASAAPRRVAVLITDGENNAGSVHPETAAEALREAGASLWVIGAGSSGEIPIDYVDPATGVRRRGIFESRFNPETLRAIARKGGGTYLSAPSAASFQAAFSRVDEAELTVRRSGTVDHEKSLRIPALLAALACILVARLVRRHYLGAFL
jgi:Ca-activated chloride channel family protein